MYPTLPTPLSYSPGVLHSLLMSLKSLLIYSISPCVPISGCKIIPSDPDCTFPRTCTSSVDFTGPSLNGTNGGQNKTIMDYGDPIYFTFFAVNGAGEGNVSTLSYFLTKEAGPLEAPSNFSVNISNTSNIIFFLSWGAPVSLDVTDSPDIFYYTLCTNITIYGSKNIFSDPDCTFPRTCTSSVDFTGPSLNGTNGGQNKTIMDDSDPIHITFFAVNGAGEGNVSTLSYFLTKEEG
ncbi:hypothetical protein EMCRGX_G003192 [Ephydatia muelleri]